MPTRQAVFWNDEMSDRDKDNISHVWRVWCDGDPFGRRCGFRRIDFSSRHVVLKALRGAMEYGR
jgi:hypothetical protein